MATWTQIKNLRLKIDDPAGIVNLETVATTGDLPSSPQPQTAYRVEATPGYYQTSVASGAVPADYSYIDILVSDTVIGEMIDAHGDMAPYWAVRRISKKLAASLSLVKTQSGADSVQYAKLLDMYKYYVQLAQDFEAEYNKTNNINTGIYGTTSQPEIAGGNV